LLLDFQEFNPQSMRSAAVHGEIEQLYDENSFSFFANESEIRAWGNDLHRYQLVFFSNFLTTPALIGLFQQQLAAALRQQRRGGIVVVMGGIGRPYPDIYGAFDGIANGAGHRRIIRLPEAVDDTSRRPYFPLIKQFQYTVWKHLERVGDPSQYERREYPPYWDPKVPISDLKPFALRVYRKPYNGSRPQRTGPPPAKV
jgi:hypothetical protein